MVLSPWLTGLAVAAAVVALVAGRAGQNLALHKPTKASSTRYGRPESLVNGVVEWGSYGLWTHDEHGPWVVIDLQDRHRIREVRIYGRGDGFLDEGGAPLTISFSTDGRAFSTAGQCPSLTTQVSPCYLRAEGAGAPARYVRIEHPQCLVLSEVEVYGAP